MLTQEEMMVLFRDMMTALDVGKKAEMGYYDVEIDAFGCAFSDKGERNYLISLNADKIYDFMETAALKHIYPTFIAEKNFKKPIPKGLKESIEMELKRDLANEMKNRFSYGFLTELDSIASMTATDNASDLLDDYMNQLEDTFDKDKFDLFENTLVFAVSKNKLSIKDYGYLLNRVNEERKNTSMLRPQDIFSQKFYAFAYEQGGKRAYFYDARKYFAYAKRYMLEKTGAVVSPLFTKECFYNYEYRLIDARKDFTKTLPLIFDDVYFKYLSLLYALPAAIEKNEFALLQADLVKKYGTDTEQTLTKYGYRWNLL